MLLFMLRLFRFHDYFDDAFDFDYFSLLPAADAISPPLISRFRRYYLYFLHFFFDISYFSSAAFLSLFIAFAFAFLSLLITLPC